MSRIIILPSDQIVIIDGRVANNVSMVGLSTIHAIQWYDTEGMIEFPTVSIGITANTPSSVAITTTTLFDTQIAEAADIFNAQDNPIVAYATTAAGVAVGSSISITSYPQTTPVGYTTDYAPGISTYSNFNLYWEGAGIGFTWSPWPTGASTATAIDAGQEWINGEMRNVLQSTDWIDSQVAMGGTFNMSWYNWRVGVSTYTRQKIDDLEALTDINDVYNYVTSDWYFSIPFVPLTPAYRP